MTKNPTFSQTDVAGRGGIGQLYLQRRLRSAREFRDDGKSLMALSELWGISYHGAYAFLSDYDQCLLREIMQNKSRGVLVSQEETRRRIQITYRHLTSGGTKTSASREIGMSLPGLSLWLKNNVSDGICQAYEDYFEEEEMAA